MAYLDELDNDLRAAMASKGWDRLTDTQAAAVMAKSYVNLEKTRPDPARTLTLPAEASDPAWANVYQRLGAPKDATGYSFDGVTFGDGTVPEAPVLDFVRQTAAKYHMSVDAAKGFAQDYVASIETSRNASQTALTEKLTAGEASLRGEWKEDYDNRTAVAGRALGAIGLEKDVVDALVNTLGVDRTMKMGYDLGLKMGEPDLLKGDPGSLENNVDDPTKVTRTRDEAMRERNRLSNDTEFQEKVAKSDPAALKLIEVLTQQMVGTQDNWSSVPKGFGRTRDDKTGQMVEYV